MPIYSGDVKLLKSAVMADVPEGGGAPTGTEIPDGVSNAIMPDVSEVDRAGGRVNFRKVIPAIQTDDTDTYFGGNVIVAEPPQDPLVSITLFATGETFDTRDAAINKVEQYLNRGPKISGYLLENHVAGQRNIQLFQRPGTAPPNIGRTLVMVLNEEQPTEQVQYVRAINVESEERTFTEIVNGQPVDFQADVVTVELSDALRYNWPGSPPSRTFAANSTKTQMRDTIVADAGSYYGAVALALPAVIGDTQVKADSVYTQLVPNARTETPTLDQKPAAQRLLTLATTPRLIEVAAAPHTMRIRVGQENRGFSWVQILKPLPAPGSIAVNYMALGAWYALYDDGAGNLTGAGVGTVNYTTGSISITLPSLPDAGSSIIFSWGENTAYTNRAGQAGFRAPEFAWSMPHQGIKPNSVTITWTSGGATKTVADNGAGVLSGSGGAGEIDYATGKVYLRPTAMIDAGGEFQSQYQYTTTITQNFVAPSLDAGGFGALTLDQAPAARSITVRWITVRNVSSSTGTSEIVSKSATNTELPATVSVDTPLTRGNLLNASKTYAMPGDTITFNLETASPQTAGTYTWSIDAYTYSGTATDDSLVLGGATSGTFSVTPKQVPNPTGAPGNVDDPDGACVGSFTLTVDASCPDLRFTVWVANQALSPIASSPSITVDAVGDQPAKAWPDYLPEPAITAPSDTQNVAAPIPMMAPAGIRYQDAATAVPVYVQVDPALQPSGPYAGGYGYDLPDLNRLLPVVWTAAEYAAGQKQILSKAGVLTTYKIWGNSYV